MKKNISIYVRNSEDGPSCYYRICQFLDELNSNDSYVFTVNDAVSRKDFRKNLDVKNGVFRKINKGIAFIKILFNRSKAISKDIKNKPDLIIIQREIFPRYFPNWLHRKIEFLLQSNYIVWDFDDDILESHEISLTEWNLLNQYSNKIVATNSYLLSKLDSPISDKIALPTTDGFFKRYNFFKNMEDRKKVYSSVVRLVWVGTVTNLNNIVNVIPYIEQASKRLNGIKQIELCVVCNVDDPSLYEKYDNLSIKYKRWTREIAEECIVQAHIGLMPLPNTVFSKGKGGFKLIQYMSTGLPVIASAIGMNCDIVSSDMGFLIDEERKWTESIYELAINADVWEKFSANSKSRYDSFYSYEYVLGEWSKILTSTN